MIVALSFFTARRMRWLNTSSGHTRLIIGSEVSISTLFLIVGLKIQEFDVFNTRIRVAPKEKNQRVFDLSNRGSLLWILASLVKYS